MRRLALFILSLVGLFDASFLWWAYTTPSRPMVCAGGGCDEVRASIFAHVLGVPTPVFGVAMYLLLALALFFEPLVDAARARRLRQGVTFISGAGFVVSLYLTGVEAFVLHAWCMWCVISALAVTAIFFLSILDVYHPSPILEGALAKGALKRHVAALVVVIAAGVPAFWVLARAEAPAPTPPTSSDALRQYLIRPDSHVFGNPDSPVTMVEFGDFQCPYCGQTEKTIRRLRQDYGSRVRFVFRQYPIPVLHAFAEKAAEASECAAEQGKFWPALDMFYDHQTDLTVPALENYASQLGLDTGRFNRCLESGAMVARVAQDMADARALGVNQTPTFFIDNIKVVGGLDYAQFAELLNRELASRGTAPAATAGATSPQPPSAATSASSSAAPAAGGSLFGSGPGSALTQIQGIGAGCSEEEAKQQQPAMVSTTEAQQYFRNSQEYLFVDVRPPAEYARAHISGAVNMPLNEIARKSSTLPKNRNIVLYESGRADGGEGDICAASRSAGRYLLTHGFAYDRVKVYQGGLTAWEKARLPVEKPRPSGM